MADGGAGNQSPATIFQARLLTIVSTGPTLSLAPYQGNKVVVSGLTVVIPQTGLTRDVADNLIDAAGADAGAPPAASTLYYVYISNQRSPFSPSSIRLSATAPSFVNGVKYLGATGNALNWRFVGWVRPNATPLFEMSDQNALIVNYYNRLLYRVFANPGYVDDDTITQYSVSGNWAKANGGTGSQVKIISNGEDIAQIIAYAVTGALSGDFVRCGPGIDSTPPLVSAFGITLATAQASDLIADDSKVLSEGYHTVDLYGSGDASANFKADDTRNGAPVDPRCSMIKVKVYV